MKKIVTVLLCLIVFCVSSCSNVERHVYNSEDRVILSRKETSSSSSSAVYSAPPEEPFEYTVCHSDLIIEGEIVEVGEAFNEQIKPGIPLTLTLTPYTIKVDDVWYGEYKQKSVLVVIRGDANTGVTKPHLYDKGVFLLREYGDNRYTLCMAEAGIFIKNPPDDTLYSFTSHDSFVCFDNKPVSSLKKEFKTTLDNIAKTGGQNSRLSPGKVGKSYVEAYKRDVLNKEVASK